MLVLALIGHARAQSANACGQAARAAEQVYALPPGLLLAIGQVESGRWDSQSGRVVPWPWSIDVDGQGRQLDSAAAAIDATRQAQAANPYNIDVGCFQISLRHHPDAFSTLAQAFDPQANALYAARFLASLRARLGNWPDAIAAYHSAAPQSGIPYRDRVYAAWTGGDGIMAASATPFTTIYGIRVWAPDNASDAPTAISVNPATPSALPRVITPAR